MSNALHLGPFSYSVFGLRFDSDLDFPELAEVQQEETADAEIRLGEVPSAAWDSVHPVPIEGGAGFRVPDVASYAVLGGRRIVVDPDKAADPRNVRLYLLGSAMGLLLHQRGILPLHANAVEIDGKAVAFMGPSGAGKSTLAAWFHDRGLRIVADDVCAIRFDGPGRPCVAQGLPRLRLWRSALEATGRSADHFERSYAGDEEWDKFDVPLGRSNPETARLPLAAIYLLEQGEQFKAARLQGVRATDALYANTYRGQFLDGTQQARNHWEVCLKLIETTPIFLVSRRWGFDEYDDQAGRLLDQVRKSVANSAAS